MRYVLCYGDSNTHGQIPGGMPMERFGPDQRWPGVLAAELGAGWHVYEEGLCGRTTVYDDPIEGALKNGRSYLRPCVMSHAPLDLIIIMLGTNDLKARFNQPPSEVAMGIGCLIYDVKELIPGPKGSVPEIMIVAPPPMQDDIKEWQGIFMGAPEKSRQLAREFEITADSLEVHFLDAASVIECDPIDGFHMGEHGHKLLGEAIAREVESIGWNKEE
jgi:lysophospholipase L1-like esterase